MEENTRPVFQTQGREFEWELCVAWSEENSQNSGHAYCLYT